MADRTNIWPVIIALVLPWLLVTAVVYLTHSTWTAIIIGTAYIVLSSIIIIRYLNSKRDAAIFERLVETQKPDVNFRAFKLLADIASPGAERKPAAIRAADVVRGEFGLERFIIFFRENDKFIPRTYSGLNKNDFANPPAHRLAANLKNGLQYGALSNNETDSLIAFKTERASPLNNAITFAYSWLRSRAVLVVADDLDGHFSEIVRDANFNRVFWPGLENYLKLDSKLHEKVLEARDSSQQLEQAKRDIGILNRELKNKLIDLQSFVKISNDLYSLFNEEQLFKNLIEIVCTKLDSSLAAILVPSGDGRFVARDSATKSGQETHALAIDTESELFGLLAKATRPVILPLAGSGFRQDEPFLAAAIRSGIQVAVSIKIGGQVACVLLVGEKNDKSQFTGIDLDFLYIISNIASLSLENIHQYSTIERLSYTDSMTGVYNYRYFYKRLGEEILRAKRYDRELSLVILDIDNFKSFNDNYGHQAGDLVLKQLSELITKTIRSIDVVSRYGGEEFCIIMPDTGVANCEAFIERLRSEIAGFSFESELFAKGISISVSVGGAVYPHHAPMPDRLIYCADMALLKAKSMGRNRAIMYKPELSLESNSVEGGFNESHQESIL